MGTGATGNSCRLQENNMKTAEEIAVDIVNHSSIDASWIGFIAHKIEPELLEREKQGMKDAAEIAKLRDDDETEGSLVRVRIVGKIITACENKKTI